VILVVDDFQDSAVGLCGLLALEGYRCQYVCGGREAIATIRSLPLGQPLLVVLDDMMPEMTGIEVAVSLRADERTKLTTIIMHSACFDGERRDQAATLGVVAWLLKGGTANGGVDGIIQTISHWYEKAGGVRQSGGSTLITKPTYNEPEPQSDPEGGRMIRD
jgi:CheY-like chemotaxis protein